MTIVFSNLPENTEDSSIKELFDNHELEINDFRVNFHRK